MKAGFAGGTVAFGAAQPATSMSGYCTDSRPHRRATRRVPHHVPCRLTVIDPHLSSTSAFIGETIDLSSAGLAVRVAQSLPIGTRVETLVPHLTGEPLLVRGMVIRSRQVLHGQYELAIVRQDA